MKFKRRGESSVVSVHDFDETAFLRFKTICFSSYFEEWFDFVSNCRMGRDTTDYDIVMGGIADDKVFDTMELYFDGLINRKEAIKRLRYAKPNYQVALRSQMVIDESLRFVRGERV